MGGRRDGTGSDGLPQSPRGWVRVGMTGEERVPEFGKDVVERKVRVRKRVVSWKGVRVMSVGVLLGRELCRWVE